MNIKDFEMIISENPFSTLMQMELVEVEDGYALGKMPFGNNCKNNYGGMHGGCIFSLADTIAGIAASTCGYYVTTVDADFHYLLPVKDTEYVWCKAKRIRQGRSIGVYEVQVFDDQERILDQGMFTYFKLDQKMDFFKE